LVWSLSWSGLGLGLDVDVALVVAVAVAVALALLLTLTLLLPDPLLASVLAFAYHCVQFTRTAHRRPPEWDLAAFGEKLRKRREERGISLDAISNATKISGRILRALEEEHFEQLPGGIFSKGFVRAYARQVGLNEQETVAEYLIALRESQIQAQNILPDFRTQPAAPPSAPTVRADAAQPSAPASSIGNILGLSVEETRKLDRRNNDRRNNERRNNDRLSKEGGGKPLPDNPAPAIPSGYAQQGSSNGNTRNPILREENHRQTPLDDRPEDRLEDANEDRPAFFRRDIVEDPPQYPEDLPTPGIVPLPALSPSASRSVPVPWKKLGAALALIFVVVLIWNSLRHRRTTPAASSNIQAQSAPAAAPVAPSAVPDAVHASVPAKKTRVPAPPATRPAAATTHTRAPKPPARFTLLIRADKTTWVSIAADGNPAERETLIAPANTSVRATHEVIVKTGDPKAISFLLNGKTIHPPDSAGESQTFIFKAAGLQSPGQGQSPAANP